MAERAGAIPSNLSIGAGQAIRRNAGDTAFEAFTPTAGSGLADADYGDIVVSGGGTVMSIDTGVSVTLANTGLNVRDGGGDHNLRIRPAEDLTADRVLSITVNDANRALTLSADATISGTNTGDQTLYNQTIEDEGTPVTQRSNINFTGAGVSVADSGGKTVVTIGGGLTIGDAVTGGGANRVLYEDGSQNLAASSRFTFNGQTLVVQAENSSQTADIFNINRYDGATALRVDDDTTVTLGGSYDYVNGKHALQHVFQYAGTSFSGRGLKLVDISGGAVVRLHAYGGGTPEFWVTNDTGSAVPVVADIGNAAGYRITGSGASFAINNGNFAIGSNWQGFAALEVVKTTEQVRIGYDTSNYAKVTVASNGAVTIDAVGSGAKFTFSDDVEVPDEAYGAGWNGSTEVPTKNALYDKIETISGGGGSGDVVGDDTSTTTQNIVAYAGTGGKNVTELTGTQGDVLYHNGTSWQKLGAGTLGQYLITNGSGANPAWSFGAIVHSSTSAGATTTAANTTPVSVTGASFSYVASAVYRIWVMGRLNSTAATTGAALQFDLSSAVTAINVQGFHTLAATGTLSGFSSIADDTSQAVSSGVPAGPLDVPIWATALLVTGANTGTCQLRLRSETTAVTELMAGAVMIVERVA